MIENRELFAKIAESLMGDYVRVYLVNTRTNEYRRYLVDQNSHFLNEEQKGNDFFYDLAANIRQMVYEEDRHFFLADDLKENLLKQFRNGNRQSFVYRLEINGKPVYHNMRLIHEYMDGDEYFIIGVQNVDKVARKQMHVDEIAYMDTMTGARNKNAYRELEEEYQLLIKKDEGLRFGIVVCDVNNLKIINDAMGHKAGDELLQSVCNLLCNTFLHSTIYRVGGDEFVVILKDRDYRERVDLFNGLRQTIINNQNIGEGPVAATGMSIYKRGIDQKISDVFERADEEMYDDKRSLKERTARLNIDQVGHDGIQKIPAIRKARLDSFFGVLHVAAAKGYIFFCDIRYDFSRWDKQVVDNYGLPAEYMYNAGGIWEKRIHPDDREYYHKRVEAVFSGDKEEFELSYRVKGINGNYNPCTCRGLLIRNEHGEPEYFGGVLFIREGDAEVKISEKRKQQLDSLFEAFSIIADKSNVYLCDMDYDYSRWSKGLVEEFGLPSEYMYDAATIWEEHIHPIDKQAYRDMIDSLFQYKTSGFDLQYRARRADGEYDICSGLGILIKDENGQPEYFGGAIRNHRQHSHIDTLTGLRNQYGFFEDISRYIQNRREVRIAVLGISKLAEINAVYGYSLGNIVLQRFGRYLMEHVGDRSGTYHLDGSRFAVITENQTFEELKKTYDKIRAHFREGLVVDGIFVALELNASTLVLDDYDTDNQTVYACLNFAYKESKSGKHGELVEFRNDFRTDERLRIAQLHVIRNSITKGYRGFYLLYQPVVDADTEELIGAEALLRWKNKEYGVVPPDTFISLLESDPLFPDLGEWILRTALEDAKKILCKKPDFVINVNLSYVQLEQEDFTDKVWNALKTTGFPADHLCFEITERCRLLDMDLLRNVIITLRAGGVRIALDDFGTGYSSIGLMKSLPFDTIKIDRSFVQKIEEDDKERKLVNNLADAASIFGAKVCVEGIETSGMRDILREYGIHSFQGYYYSKPIAKEDVIEKYCV